MGGVEEDLIIMGGGEGEVHVMGGGGVVHVMGGVEGSSMIRGV